MVKLGYPEKIGILVAGAVLSVIGMMDYTGITKWGTGYGVLACGYVVCIAGLLLIFLDLRESASVLEDYDEAMTAREALGNVPDDGFCVSLDGEQEYEDDTELCDLTAEPADNVPEVD